MSEVSFCHNENHRNGERKDLSENEGSRGKGIVNENKILVLKWLAVMGGKRRDQGRGGKERYRVLGVCDGCHQLRDLSRHPQPLLPHTSGEEPSSAMGGLRQGSNGVLEVQDPAVGKVLKRRNQMLQQPRS